MALQFADLEEATSVLGSPASDCSNQPKNGTHKTVGKEEVPDTTPSLSCGPEVSEYSENGGRGSAEPKLDGGNLKPTSVLELDRNLDIPAVKSVKGRKVIKANRAKKGKFGLLCTVIGMCV